MTLPRPKAFYFFYYAAAACLVPFLTVYYQSLGLSGAQIGILAGIVPLMTLVGAPIWGGIADVTDRHRLALLAALGGVFVAVAAMSQMATFGPLLVVVTIYAFFVSPIPSLIDNTVVDMLGPRRADYGKVRLWGALGWGLAALAIGPLLERAGLEWAFYGYLLGTVVTIVVAWGLPVAAVGPVPAYRAALSVLLRQWRFLLLLMVGLVFGLSLGVILNYLFLYMADLGGTPTMMALTLTIATVSEVPFWFISGRLLSRFGATAMVSAALLMTAARVFAYAWMPAAWWALPVSLFHGVTFSVIWAAGVNGAAEAAPTGLGATAQGLFSAMVFGLGAALGAFLGGLAFDSIGPVRLFTLNGWIVLVTLAVFVGAHAWAAVRRRSLPLGAPSD